jgi:hypothetical protein
VTEPRVVSPAFLRAHTTPARPTLVPEVQLLVADDVVALWEAMETEGGGAGQDPPFWAAATPSWSPTAASSTWAPAAGWSPSPPCWPARPRSWPATSTPTRTPPSR